MMTPEQYVKVEGCRCPKCESFELEAFHTAFDGYKLIQSITCNDCGTEWYDVYNTKLTGYENLEVA